MDNNSNHTSIFVDTGRNAQHFEYIVSFNPPATLGSNFLKNFSFMEEAVQTQKG